MGLNRLCDSPNLRPMDSRLIELGYFPEVIRGSVCLAGAEVHRIVGGIPINFVRRRYGRSDFYCWVEAFIAGEWKSLGDPWPKVTPAAAEIEREIKARL